MCWNIFKQSAPSPLDAEKLLSERIKTPQVATVSSAPQVVKSVPPQPLPAVSAPAAVATSAKVPPTLQSAAPKPVKTPRKYAACAKSCGDGFAKRKHWSGRQEKAAAVKVVMEDMDDDIDQEALFGAIKMDESE